MPDLRFRSEMSWIHGSCKSKGIQHMMYAHEDRKGMPRRSNRC